MLIRLLEGYWGFAGLGRDLAVIRTRHHRRHLLTLQRREGKVNWLLNKAMSGQLDPAAGDAETATIRAAVVRAETQREQQGYPQLEQLLPTRLGNVLRRHELTHGQAYGMSAIDILPLVAMVAPAADRDYLQDQRMQLELAVRTAFLSLLAAVVTVGFMLGHGWWVLLALVPYGFGYLAYRGAVMVAGLYGSAIAMIIELNRFALYERLHLEHPGNTTAERTLNEQLTLLLAGSTWANLRYEKPPKQAEP